MSVVPAATTGAQSAVAGIGNRDEVGYLQGVADSSGRTAPAYELQREAGAKFGDFAGWSMPLEYAGGGVLAEHAAVREAVGLFDVSHMGTFRVTGQDAAVAVNEVLTNDLAKISSGQAQYSLLCNESGGVIDDVFVYRCSDEEVVIVPNAANAQVVVATVERVAESKDAVVRDVSATTAIFAVQGPRAGRVLTDVGLLPAPDLEYLRFRYVADGDAQVLVARTGYTGEYGFELVADAAHAPALWQRLLVAVAAAGGAACGLGARDTLRTEMGYPLHGHELSPSISPLEAGLSWAIGWNKPAFPGRRALIAQKAAGVDRRLVGLRCTERGVPRSDMAVVDLAQPELVLGRTTSGTFSPTLKTGIALAFVNSDVEIGSQVAINVRGRTVAAEVVPTPFVASSPRADSPR